MPLSVLASVRPGDCVRAPLRRRSRSAAFDQKQLAQSLASDHPNCRVIRLLAIHRKEPQTSWTVVGGIAARDGFAYCGRRFVPACAVLRRRVRGRARGLVRRPRRRARGRARRRFARRPGVGVTLISGHLPTMAYVVAKRNGMFEIRESHGRRAGHAAARSHRFGRSRLRRSRRQPHARRSHLTSSRCAGPRSAREPPSPALPPTWPQRRCCESSRTVARRGLR